MRETFTRALPAPRCADLGDVVGDSVYHVGDSVYHVGDTLPPPLLLGAPGGTVHLPV